MHQDTIVRFRKKDEVIDPLTELLRRGAGRTRDLTIAHMPVLSEED